MKILFYAERHSGFWHKPFAMPIILIINIRLLIQSNNQKLYSIIIKVRLTREIRNADSIFKFTYYFLHIL